MQSSLITFTLNVDWVKIIFLFTVMWEWGVHLYSDRYVPEVLISWPLPGTSSFNCLYWLVFTEKPLLCKFLSTDEDQMLQWAKIYNHIKRRVNYRIDTCHSNFSLDGPIKTHFKADPMCLWREVCLCDQSLPQTKK